MNILGYARQNKKTFEEDPINEVDYLILAWATYYDYSFLDEPLPITFGKLAEKRLYVSSTKPYYDCYQTGKTVQLTRALSSSPRFKDIQIIKRQEVIDLEKSIQFAATAFRVGEKVVVAFKGTGAAYVGWKEDFMLSYQEQIESHRLAREFVEEILKSEQENLILIGHSKGGNLATNTLFTLENADRIESVISFDGPGFRSIPANFDLSRKDRISKYIPQSSVVGVFFNPEAEFKIVQSGGLFVFQHDPFTWFVKGSHFVFLSKRTVYSTNVDEALANWIDSLSDEDKEKFVFMVFGALQGLKAKDFNDFNRTWLFQIAPLLKAYRGLDKENQAVINRVIKSLGKHLSATRAAKRKRPKPAAKPSEKKAANKSAKGDVK